MNILTEQEKGVNIRVLVVDDNDDIREVLGRCSTYILFVIGFIVISLSCAGLRQCYLDLIRANNQEIRSYNVPIGSNQSEFICLRNNSKTAMEREVKEQPLTLDPIDVRLKRVEKMLFQQGT